MQGLYQNIHFNINTFISHFQFKTAVDPRENV